MSQVKFIDGIVGTRPNMMKMAPLARALAKDGRLKLRLIHTGQHYDSRMSDVFFKELGMPEPSINFNVGSGTQSEQTARIMCAYEKLLLTGDRPRGVVVVGDVTSTMACTIVSAKLGIPVAHVEAGLRSGDRGMPEEINRIVTDSLSDLMFVSDPDGLWHLANEGRPRERMWLVGNIMADSLMLELENSENLSFYKSLGLNAGEYAFMTLHRPSNVDDPENLKSILFMVSSLSKELPVVFSLHPRTRQIMNMAGIEVDDTNFRIIDPLSYRENISMIKNSKMVLTDSGGIQEESSLLNVPCLTLRENTERPITVELGSSELLGNDSRRIKDAWSRVMSNTWKSANPIPLWDGKTAERIVTHICREWL